MRSNVDHNSPIGDERCVALEQLVGDFITDRRAYGLSPRTIEAYETRLTKVLLPFCARQGIDSVESLDRGALNRLSLELQDVGPGGRPLSRDSVVSYLNTVNIWLNWCAKEGAAAPARARLPKLGRRLVDVLSSAEIQQLEDAATTERDKLIVRVLAETGIRAGELLDLRAGDLKRVGSHRFIQVRGKGAKERLVPIGTPQLFTRLEKLARGLEPDDRILRTLRRRPGREHEPISLDALEGMLRNLRVQAGMTKRVYAHLFRHSFATRMLNRNMSPVQLARILGHDSLRMIDQVYSHLSAGDAYEAMLKALAID